MKAFITEINVSKNFPAVYPYMNLNQLHVVCGFLQFQMTKRRINSEVALFDDLN